MTVPIVARPLVHECDVEGVELGQQLWRNVVELNLMMTGLYFDGLMAVLRGEQGAVEALAQIEARDGADS